MVIPIVIATPRNVRLYYFEVSFFVFVLSDINGNISLLILLAVVNDVYENPCIPSPCGPYSQCRLANPDTPVCSCLLEYVGSPPNCHPECTISSECPLDKACINSKCKDPCPGTCGQNAECHVNNHSPICSCQSGYTGDPFHRCYSIPRKITYNFHLFGIF